MYVYLFVGVETLSRALGRNMALQNASVIGKRDGNVNRQQNNFTLFLDIPACIGVYTHLYK